MVITILNVDSIDSLCSLRSEKLKLSKVVAKTAQKECQLFDLHIKYVTDEQRNFCVSKLLAENADESKMSLGNLSYFAKFL